MKISCVSRPGWFYQDELQAAPEVKYRGILAYDTPVVWFDTAIVILRKINYPKARAGSIKKRRNCWMEQLQAYIEKISKERVLDESIDFGTDLSLQITGAIYSWPVKRNAFLNPSAN